MENDVLQSFVNFAAENTNVKLELENDVLKISPKNLLREFFGEINYKHFNCKMISYNLKKNTFLFEDIKFSQEQYDNSELDIDLESIREIIISSGNMENMLFMKRATA